MHNKISDLLSLESPPFTLNECYYEEKYEEYLQKFKHADPVPYPHEVAPRALEPALWRSHNREIIMMARCEAYFRVSYKGIIDHLPRTVNGFFLRPLSNDLQPFLMGVLGTEGDDPVAAAKLYLQEDASVASKRAALTQLRDRLEQALEVISDFEASLA